MGWDPVLGLLGTSLSLSFVRLLGLLSESSRSPSSYSTETWFFSMREPGVVLVVAGAGLDGGAREDEDEGERPKNLFDM